MIKLNLILACLNVAKQPYEKEQYFAKGAIYVLKLFTIDRCTLFKTGTELVVWVPFVATVRGIDGLAWHNC